MNVIILNPFKEKQWTTGGERRLKENQEYFRRRTKNTDVISYSDFPFKINAMHFLRANIWLFQRIKTQYSSKNKTVFIYPTTCSLFTFLTTILLRIFCQTKIVITAEHFKNPFSPNLKSFLTHGAALIIDIICLHSAHLVIAVSKSAQIECKKMGAKPKKIKIVPNGIDKICSGARQDGLEEHNKTVNVLCVGYCAKIKGIYYLVEAMGLLKSQGQSDYFLYFVGDTQKDPEYFKKIERYIYTNSLDDRIRFYGEMYNRSLECFWEKADMFVLPSLWESYCLVIVEAMGRGIPVISTKVGAIPELVTDGVTGLLVPPKDSRALAETIQRLSKDSSLRKKVIEGGHRVAANCLSWEQSCERFYQQVLTVFNWQRT